MPPERHRAQAARMTSPCASSERSRPDPGTADEAPRLVRLRIPPEAERRRARMARRRAGVLIGVHALAAIHIAHWLIAGRTLAPLELNEVLHTLHLGVLTAGFLFMALALVATALFGRFFCSWGCHVLALQDLSAWLLAKASIRPRPIRSRALLLLPFGMMLYLSVWPQIERIAGGRPLPALHVATDAEGWASFVTSDFWRNLPGPVVTLLTLFVCGMAIVYVLGSRSFCRYGCPYGALFGLADRLAPGRIVQSGDCEGCGACTAVCQSHVRVHEEIRATGMVVDPRCLKDLDCVSVCPNGALRYAAVRPPILRPRPSLPPAKHDLSLGEDALWIVVTLATLLVLRGLYGAVSFLLALGTAIIVGAAVVLALRLRRRPRVRLGHLDLRRGSQLTRAGLAFLLALGASGVVLAHSAVVRWHEVRGGAAFDEAHAAVLRGVAPSRDDLDRGAEHLEAALRIGLFAPASLHRRLASIYELRGAPRLAARHLSAVLAADPGDAEARMRMARARWSLEDAAGADREVGLVLEATSSAPMRAEAHALRARVRELDGDLEGAILELRGAIDADPEQAPAQLALGVLLARRGEPAQAIAHLERACALAPRDARARTSLAAALAELGRIDEATDAARAAVRVAPRDAAAHANLGLLLAARGDLRGARAHLRRALALDPDDADARTALAALDSSLTEEAP